MDVKRIIEKYDIEEYFDGGEERKIRLWTKPSAEDLEFVKTHKSEILEELRELMSSAEKTEGMSWEVVM